MVPRGFKGARGGDDGSGGRMRCPECGEENRQLALLCGLCKTLFVPPARPSQVVSVLGRPSQAVPVLEGTSDGSGAVREAVPETNTSRPYVVVAPTARPSQAVPVLGRGTQSVPVLGTGRGTQSVPVLGRGTQSVPVLGTGRGTQSVPVLGPARGTQSVPVLGRPSQAVPVLGRASQSVPVLGRASQSVPVLGRPSQSMPVLGRASQSVPVLGRADYPSQAVPVLIRDGETSRSVTVNIPIIQPARRSMLPVWVAAAALVLGGAGAILSRRSGARRGGEGGLDVTAGAGPTRGTESGFDLFGNAWKPPTFGPEVDGPDRARPADSNKGAPAPALPRTIVEELPGPLPARPAVSSGWYEGAEGYRHALEEQKRTLAPLLVYFRADWCSYCKTMDRDVLTTAAATRYLDQVIKVRVSSEASSADQALMKSFGAVGFPALFVSPAPDASAQPVPEFTRSGRERLTLEADKFVTACEEVGRGHARALVRGGVAKIRAHDYPGARAELDRALEVDPRNAEAFFWRGYGEELVGSARKAAGDFRRAVELDPQDPRPYAELARLYGRNRQFDDAIGALDRLIDVAPRWQRGLAFGMRGLAQAEKGNRARAAADFAEACRQGHAPSCTFQGAPTSGR
jgi:tetratricopeptide (TPR) repeat protein